MRKMAELTIRPDEIREALARFVEDYEPGGIAREEVGTVVGGMAVQIGDDLIDGTAASRLAEVRRRLSS